MSTVPFASTCEAGVLVEDGDLYLDWRLCDARSPEYTAWPRCRHCGLDFCPDHYDPTTLIDADLDSPATVLCYTCAAQSPNQQ